MVKTEAAAGPAASGTAAPAAASFVCMKILFDPWYLNHDLWILKLLAEYNPSPVTASPIRYLKSFFFGQFFGQNFRQFFGEVTAAPFFGSSN